jgi:uncharacterized protein involved in propanediol utilization
MLSEEGHVGTASAPVHHGEILQGVFMVGDHFQRGLVTLPCDIYTVRARFTTSDRQGITISPGWKLKAKRAAEFAVSALRERGISAVGGRLEITSEVPVGQGFGSSTSDVLAAIRAVADAFSAGLAATTVARIAVAAETASDSLMFEDSSILFAQRDGEVIEDFGERIPRLSVIGFFSRPDGGVIDTLALGCTPYSPYEIGTFCELRSKLREAIATHDAALLGEVATASAEINQRYLPVLRLAHIRAIARAAGSVGLQVSHSGNIAGLLFDASDDDVAQRISYSQKLLVRIGFSEQWQFELPAAAV